MIKAQRSAEAIISVIVIILVFLVSLTMAYINYTQGYRHGQIDYATGKIKYILKDNPDGTRAWVRK
jgi:hypothetical protein